jgi:hypothetical protein
VLRAMLALSLCASIAHADGYRMRERTPVVPSPVAGPKATICIDPAFLRRVIRRHLAEITGCYERQIRRTPKLAGTATARFVVLPDGQVVEAAVSGMTADLGACIARALEGIRCPRRTRGGAVTVSYPFTFSQRGS